MGLLSEIASGLASVVGSKENAEDVVRFASDIITGVGSKIYSDSAFKQFQAGNFDKAVADATKALELDANDTTAYLCRGMACFELERYEQAVQDLTAGLKIAPNRTEAYFYRGKAYTGLGEFDAAIADFEKALEADPNNEEYKYYLTECRKALAELDEESSDDDEYDDE